MFYDAKYASVFDEIFNDLPSTNQTLHALSAILANPGSNVLEHGAGTGRLAIPLAQRGHTVTACEPSAPMRKQLALKLERSQESVSVLKYAMCDSVPISGQDLVLCVMGTLACLPQSSDQRTALSQMRFQIAPKGMIVIESFNFEAITQFSSKGSHKVTQRLANGGTLESTYSFSTQEKRMHGKHRLESEIHSDSVNFSEEVLATPIDEVTEWAHEVGLVAQFQWGDWTGKRFDPETDGMFILGLTFPS